MKGANLKLQSYKLYPYQAFTVMLSSFIIGIWLSNFISVNLSAIVPKIIFILCMLLLATFINKMLKNDLLATISWAFIIIFLGIAINFWQYKKYFNTTIDLNEVSAIVINNPTMTHKNQELILEVRDKKQATRILVKAPRQPKIYVGDIVKVSGKIEKPGMIEDFDYARYLKPKKVSLIAINPQKVEIVGSDPSAKYKVLRVIYAAKNKLEEALGRLFHEPYAALSIGLITGAKQSMPQELNDNLSISGLTHIVALSGFNVTIIIIVLTAILANIVHRKNIFIIGSILVVAFIIMTGASASVVRAGIFSLLVLYGKTIGRRSYQTNILLLAAVLMLFFNPFLLTNDIGFQLSFLAFCGIIYLSKFMDFLLSKSIFAKLPEWLKSPFTETLSAQILVLPLIAFSFGRVSLISPLSNIAVLWIIPFTMLLSFVSGILGLIFLPLGKIAAFITYPVLVYIIELIDISAKLPLASLNLQKYNYFILVSAYLFIGICVYIIKNRMTFWQKRLYE